MRKTVPGNLLVIISGLILFLLSCTPEACFEETDSSVKAIFCLKTTKKRLAPDSLTVYGLNMELNMLYNNVKSPAMALLPLNIATGNCSYIININGKSDTIEFHYNSYPHIISKECGYTFYHNLNADSLIYSRNIIDSIGIVKEIVTNKNEENIRIYY